MQCLDGKLMAEEKLSLYCALGTPFPAAINPASTHAVPATEAGLLCPLDTQHLQEVYGKEAVRIQARSPC